MRASNFEQSVEIDGEGYFDVTNKIGARSKFFFTGLQHTQHICSILAENAAYENSVFLHRIA